MKKLILLISMIPVFVLAQSQNQNYVKSTTYKGEAATLPVAQVTYFDGLGRPIQQIANAQSNTGKDIVTHIEYDAFGRQVKDYLPYANTTSSLYYNPNAKTEIGIFYNTLTYENTLNPYSAKELENSPLNRVFKQAAPGNAWTLGSGHEIKLDYQTNTATEVKLFQAIATWNPLTAIYDINLSYTGNYLANELYKTITKDENWTVGKNNTTEEFKDKEGQVVLKRTYSNYKDINGTILQTAAAHDTYYVYDQYGNLTYVIPPTASDIIIDAITLKNLCYQYKYDYRNRLVEKKLPGKEWEYIIYNAIDQPILTQDANLRAQNKWLFTKYEAFNRQAYTGEYFNSTQITRFEIQELARVLSIPYEMRNIGGFVVNGTTIYYNNRGFPSTDIDLLTINYYDDYNFDINGGISELAYTITPSVNVKGLTTGSKIRILGTTNWATNVTYYDNKSRPIYLYNKNDYLGTIDKVKNKLDFIGKTEQTTSTHQRGGVATTIINTFAYDHADKLLTHKQKINSQAEEIIASNTYDELGQLTSKGVGGVITRSNRLQTVDFDYNIRGWLKTINKINTIGSDLFAFQINYNAPTAGGTALYNGNISQTFWKTANIDSSIKNYNYTYDALNRLTQATDNLNKFNESLMYDKNGNITNLKRLGEIVGGVPNIAILSNFGVMDDLTYSYTGNQLQIVSDSSNDVTGFKDDFLSTSPDTTIDYTYDLNGNMITDTNKGITAISYNHLNLPKQVTMSGGVITYVYDATGVKQRKIVSGTTTDYAGGYIYENNVMKFCSHPEGYVENNNNLFSYIYQYKDHLGNVRLSYKDVNPTAATASLQIIEENNYYPFGLKHNGYNSVVTSTNPASKYRYNSKEYQDELNLNVYDYGARQYMPDLGRWMQSDPLINDLDFTFNPNDVDEDDAAQVEIAYHTTLGNGGGIYNRDNLNPYTYGYNDPVRFDDPDGRCPNCFTAVIGGLVGGGIELGGQLLSGKSLSEVDWADVGVETVKGALIGSGVGAGAAGLIEGGSVVAKASFDYSKKDGNQNIFNGKKSTTKAIVDGATDVVAGKVGGAIGKKIGNVTEGGVKAATKAETKATKNVVNATNKFNKATDGGRNLSGSKAMVAGENLVKAKGGAQAARGNTVRAQMVNSATKGAAGETVNKAAQNSIGDKIKNFFGF